VERLSSEEQGAAVAMVDDDLASRVYLVRYGVVPEVARAVMPTATETLQRGRRVVIQTDRGPQLAEVLDRLRASHPASAVRRPQATTAGASTAEADDSSTAETEDGHRLEILRFATAEDEAAARALEAQAAEQCAVWQQRIADWQLAVELLDLEWTLDGEKLILYVLTERGPATTQLALQAAAAGLGVIEVQPVAHEGLMSQETGTGCGSGGGCGHRHD
jgi:cell fate regulator YaaT (PSP1 superfamily)